MKTGINNAIKTGLVALGFFGILATTASAAYFDYAPAPKCDVQITRQLSNGSEGVEVTVLQNFLNRAGLLSATPNGHFGPATTAAVRAFQYQNGISATGTVGPMTRNAINERMCDTDLTANSLSYDSYYTSYGGTSGVTVVDPHDPFAPFVQVVTPNNTIPNVYQNPQSTYASPAYATNGSIVSTPVITSSNGFVPPATTNVAVASTNIIYSPSIGYTYGITPTSGTLTVLTPSANAVYNEGDTVNVVWTTSNLTASAYTVVLENSSTGQSKAVATTGGNSASFALTKDVLDAVCSSACTSYNYNSPANNYEGGYRIVVTTPIRDIAGNISTFRAAVSPVTIHRPYGYFGSVAITTNKNPVNSNEVFKLYVNIPTGAAWNANLYGQYSFKIRATCPAGVTAVIAGVPCGNDFVIPYAPVYFQSEVPASVTNTSWFSQNVTFTLTATNLAGQVIGSSQTTVTANAAPFSW
jgi:peptidoglycan hydrolase-like protein with peptidoglycan-binding domain